LSNQSSAEHSGGLDEGALPIRMLHDRVLVSTDNEPGERRSGGGIVIPATVAIGRRLAWGQVVAVGTNVRTVKSTDRVLFDPEDRAEVEVRGKDYVLLRERDLHAVASERRENRPLLVSSASAKGVWCGTGLITNLNVT
jgi:chaperonin GroES